MALQTFQAVNGFCTVQADGDFCAAVAARVEHLLPTIVQRTGAYLYDGFRTLPSELGWRVIQCYGQPSVATVESGGFDEQIVATYHEAADAEWYYMYEKDYGDFE